jgi:hypothetical protein
MVLLILRLEKEQEGKFVFQHQLSMIIDIQQFVFKYTLKYRVETHRAATVRVSDDAKNGVI